MNNISQETKFYLELPTDEYGNTAMKRAVVEATSRLQDERERLIPVAPAYHANGWPTGWYRDSYGGWVETQGPARELTYAEWKTLVDDIPQEVKDQTAHGMVVLKDGTKTPRVAVNVILISLTGLREQNPIALYELVMLCRNQGHRLFGNTGQDLVDLGLIEEAPSSDAMQDSYTVHDVTRSIILSATEGEGLDLKLVNPIAE